MIVNGVIDKILDMMDLINTTDIEIDTNKS